MPIVSVGKFKGRTRCFQSIILGRDSWRTLASVSVSLARLQQEVKAKETIRSETATSSLQCAVVTMPGLESKHTK